MHVFEESLKFIIASDWHHVAFQRYSAKPEQIFVYAKKSKKIMYIKLVNLEYVDAVAINLLAT